MGFNLLPMPWLSPPDPQEAFARGFQMYGQVVDDQMRKQQLSQQKQALDMRHAIEAQEMQLKQAEEKRRAEEAAQEMLFSTELDSSLNEQLSPYGQEPIPPETMRSAYLNAFVKASRHLPVKQAAQTFGTMERLQSQEERSAAEREARQRIAEYVQGQIGQRQERGIEAKKELVGLTTEQRKEIERFKTELESKAAEGEFTYHDILHPVTGELMEVAVLPPKGKGAAHYIKLDELNWLDKKRITDISNSIRDLEKYKLEYEPKGEKLQDIDNEINALKNRKLEMMKPKTKKASAPAAPSAQKPVARATGEFMGPPPPPASAAPAPTPASEPNPLDKISDEDDVFGIKDNNMSYPARKKPFFYRTPEGLVPKMTNTPAGLTDNAAMQVAAEKNRLDQGEPLLPPPTGDPEALSAAIRDNIFQQANTQDYRTPDTMDEEVDAERAKQFEAPAEPEDTRDEVQKLLDRGREAFPGLEVLPAPVKRQASNKLLKAAAEIEAKDHPELAKKSPEDILRIVVDELKADAKGYLNEIRKALKK